MPRLKLHRMVAASLFCCLGIWACTRKDAQTKSGEGRGGRKGGPQAVETVVIARQSVSRSVSLPVILEGRKQVEVTARVGGRVRDLARQTGDKVTRGAVLFSIDRSEPGESFLAAPVVSPISGHLAEWFVSEGDQVTPGAPAVLVVDDSALRARVHLPVSEWQAVTPSTQVEIAVDGHVQAARIVNISRAVLATAGKGLVEVEIDNAKGQWKAGFSALATLRLAPRPRLLAPSRALLLTSDGAFVYTVEGEKAARRKITFEARTPDEVEITSSELADGTALVVSGVSQLSDGAKVKVAAERKPAP